MNGIQFSRRTSHRSLFAFICTSVGILKKYNVHLILIANKTKSKPKKFCFFGPVADPKSFLRRCGTVRNLFLKGAEYENVDIFLKGCAALPTAHPLLSLSTVQLPTKDKSIFRSTLQLYSSLKLFQYSGAIVYILVLLKYLHFPYSFNIFF